MAEGPFGSNPMPLSYLNAGNGATAESMNELFGELDAKLAKAFGGGKSFILAAEDMSWMTKSSDLVNLLGMPFFFHSGGDCKYLNPIVKLIDPLTSYSVGYLSDYPYIDSFPSYDENVFERAKASANFIATDVGESPLDADRNIAKIQRINPSYLYEIGVNRNGFGGAYNSFPKSLFDHSLLKYRFEDEPETYSFDDLYLESEAIGNVCINPQGIISGFFSGDPLTVYNVPFFIEGDSEGKSYTGGTAEGSFYISGSPVASNANIWKLEISDPYSYYYFNNGAVSTRSTLNKISRKIPVRGNSYITISYDSVDGLQINPPNPHWASISKIPRSANGEGYYLQELDNSEHFYCQPERTNRYGLAEILVEGRNDISLPASGNKYDCYRVHNFNNTNLNIQIGDNNFSITPFECRTFRNFASGWGSGYHYFFPFESGDPRYFAALPYVEGTAPYASIYDTYYANNLTNPSVLYNWTEAFATEVNPTGAFVHSELITLAYKHHLKRALLYKDINVEPYDISLKYSGYYEYPITDNTILGDLVHHKGKLKIARASGLNIFNYPTDISFDEITFSGHSTLVSDFAAKGITITEDSNGNLQIEDPNLNTPMMLISESTNLLKQGEYIPKIVYLSDYNGSLPADSTPYQLETCVLDSCYYQDSIYSHVSGQNVLFQTTGYDSLSGYYISGELPVYLNLHRNTVGDLKSFLGIQCSGITGLSSFENFDIKLTTEGLLCEFDEKIPALYNLVPTLEYTSASTLGPPLDENNNPVNWFGEVKSWRQTAIPWTRLQGAWDLESNYLIRKRRLQFRGHGFGWANSKFNQTDLTQPSFFTFDHYPNSTVLYTSPITGALYLRENGILPQTLFNQGGRDFDLLESGFNLTSRDYRVCENSKFDYRDFNTFNENFGTATQYGTEWERYKNYKKTEKNQTLLDFSEVDFGAFAYYHYIFNTDVSNLSGYFTGYYDPRYFVPLLSEHYNSMVKEVNSLKYSRPLSADQWYKERFRLQVDVSPSFQHLTGYIYTPFKFINQGYNYDNDQNGTNGTYSAYPCNVPFDAYGILNRVDKRVEWGNFDINIPYDIQDWFDLNVGIDFKPSNYGVTYTEVISGASGYSYYVGYNFVSGTDGNQYLSPDYVTHGLSNYLINGNLEPNPNPILFDPQNFTGYYYLTVDSVNSFFTGIGQHFYWKNSFQPLAWEPIKTYTGVYFTKPDDLFATGLYNNLPEPIIFGTGDGVALLGTDGTVFPILETWLSPSSDNPSFRANRNLHDSAYNTASVSYAPNEEKRSRILTTLSGNNNFYYGFISGDPDSEVSGQYGSATYPLNDSVKRLWNLNWELNNTGDNRFYQLLPLGLSLFSNNENQLKWRLIGFKERFERLDQDFTFSSIDNYSEKMYQTENYNSTEVFKIDAVGANTWSGCHTYIGEEYGPHILLEMHEPVIEL